MRIHLRKSLFAVIALLLLLALAVSAGSASAEGSAPKKLTVMVYAIGTDLESLPDRAVASDYLIRMMHSGFDRSQINLVLLTGGCSYWKAGFPTDVNTVQLIEGEIAPTEVYRTEKLMNMGDGNTLTWLLDYGVANYPAESYALIVEDHGGGPLSGVCHDEIFDDMISLPELSAALKISPFGGERKLSWVYFCTCLTGSSEIAAVFAPYADYMFASEEPALSYAFRFDFLKGAETRSPEETGRIIADSCFEAAEEISRNLSSDGVSASTHRNTFSVYNLREMNRLSYAMDALFRAVNERMSSTEAYERMLRIVSNVERVNPSSDDDELDLIDLRGLVQGYADMLPNESAAVFAALDRVVIHNRSNIEQETGMLIYHPIRNKWAYRVYFQKDYRDVCPFPAYLTYTERFGSVLLGQPLTVYPSVRKKDFFSMSGSSAPVSLKLSADQQELFRDAELLILEDTGTDGMYRLISRQAVSPDDAGELNAQTVNEALYVLDADGKPLTDALDYTLVEDQILIRGVLEIDRSARALTLEDVNAVSLSEDSDFTVNVLLHCERKDDGTLRIVTVEPVHNGYADGRALNPADFDYLYLISRPRHMTVGDDGAILAWDDWEDGGVISYRYTVDLSRDWTLAFRDDQMTWAGRSAMLVVTDLQSNRYAVEWTELENPANEALPMAPQTLCDNSIAAVTAESAWLNHGPDGDSLFIRLSLTNYTDVPQSFTAAGYDVDDVQLDKRTEWLGTVQPGQTGTAVILIRASESVSPLADAGAVSLILSTESETGFGLWAPSTVTIR